jgi:hypothetical protein
MLHTLFENCTLCTRITTVLFCDLYYNIQSCIFGIVFTLVSALYFFCVCVCACARALCTVLANVAYNVINVSIFAVVES